MKKLLLAGLMATVLSPQVFSADREQKLLLVCGGQQHWDVSTHSADMINKCSTVANHFKNTVPSWLNSGSAFRWEVDVIQQTKYEAAYAGDPYQAGVTEITNKFKNSVANTEYDVVAYYLEYPMADASGHAKPLVDAIKAFHTNGAGIVQLGQTPASFFQGQGAGSRTKNADWMAVTGSIGWHRAGVIVDTNKWGGNSVAMSLLKTSYQTVRAEVELKTAVYMAADLIGKVPATGVANQGDSVPPSEITGLKTHVVTTTHGDIIDVRDYGGGFSDLAYKDVIDQNAAFWFWNRDYDDSNCRWAGVITHLEYGVPQFNRDQPVPSNTTLLNACRKLN